MTEHRYPLDVLLPDYGRAAAGLAVTAGPLPWLGGSPVTQSILGVLSLIFVGFALSTVARQIKRVHWDEQGVSTSGLRSASVRWSDLDRLALRYFSTRRDKTRGWMQLDVAGGGRTVRIDSGLGEFPDLAQRALEAARARGLRLDPVTLANAAALGLDGPADQA